MLTISQEQLSKMEALMLGEYCSALYEARNEEFAPMGITPQQLREWIIEVKKYGISLKTDVEKFIDLSVKYEKLRNRPFEQDILYYLTHPNLSASDSLAMLESTSILTIREHE